MPSSGPAGGGWPRPSLTLVLLSLGASALLLEGEAAAQADPPLLAAAREAARTDRNNQSARLFRQYIAENPGERGAVLREYADQLLYSGKPEAAHALLREVLRRPGLSAEERRRAQHSLALALSWSDQHRQALEAYGAVLADDPQDARALAGRARSFHWMGRPDKAEAALKLVPAEAARGEEAAGIRRDIERNRRPLAELSGRLTRQSDELEISAFRLGQHFYARSGAFEINPFYEHIRYRPKVGTAADVDQPSLGFRARFADWGQLAGQAALELQHFAGRDRTVPTFEASLALLPRDDLRFDLSAARRTLDNVRSIERNITADHLFASGDYWPTPLWRVTGRGDAARFSDGNERLWVQAEVERRLSRGPNIFVGARATAFGFSKLLDNGYYNPKSARSAELTARGWDQIGRRTWLDLAGSLGPEDAEPGGLKLGYSGRAKLTHGITKRLEASLTAEAFSSRAVTDAGFSRRSLIASVGWRW